MAQGDIVIKAGGIPTVEDEGVKIASRKTLNFIGAGVTVTDDSVNNEIDIEITGAAVSAGSTVVAETAWAIASTAGTSSAYSRTDHTHGSPADPGTAPSPSGTVVAETAFGGTATAGTAATYSRGDHTHGNLTQPLVLTAPQIVNNSPMKWAGSTSSTTLTNILLVNNADHTFLDSFVGKVIYLGRDTSHEISFFGGAAGGDNDLYSYWDSIAARTSEILVNSPVIYLRSAIWDTALVANRFIGAAIRCIPTAAGTVGEQAGYLTLGYGIFNTDVYAGVEFIRLTQSAGPSYEIDLLQNIDANSKTISNCGNITMSGTASVDGVDISAHATASSGVHGAGTATIATTADITTHAGAADPHAVYQLESEKSAANGYAALNASSLVTQNPASAATAAASAKIAIAGSVGTLSSDWLPANDRIANLNFIIDGAGSVITTGVKGFVQMDFAGTITQVTTLADQSGSIVVDIWKDTYANFPASSADSICSTTKPTLAGTIKAQDSTLSSWTTAIAAGDHIAFNVDSVGTVTRVTVALRVTKA